MLTAREVMVADPGASRRTLMRRAKRVVRSTDVAERLEHARSLPHQGEVHQLVEEDAASLWSETVQKLPPESLKFALNAVQDTLATQCKLSSLEKERGLVWLVQAVWGEVDPSTHPEPLSGGT